MNRGLVLAVLLVLVFPTGASASSLVGSVHDLYSGTLKGEQAKEAGDDSRVCMYCHTPHSATSGQVARWRSAGAAKSTPGFMSGGTASQGAMNGVGRSSSICLTCHDGSVAADSAFRVVRPGGAGGSTGMGMAMDKSSDVEISALSSGSTTSHPVGVPYTMSPDLVSTPPDGKFPNGVRLIDGKVECASCHNPHSATSAPFLATSNEGSNLCYTCHVK